MAKAAQTALIQATADESVYLRFWKSPRKSAPLISQQAGRPAIEQELASAHSEFKTLRENAIQLVEEGITTAEEVQRVIYETGDMKKAEEE